MKLLIVTQKLDINDDVLGFFHDWVAEFAKHCEKLTVICLEKGDYDLPKNVNVYSLGKEKACHPERSHVARERQWRSEGSRKSESDTGFFAPLRMTRGVWSKEWSEPKAKPHYMSPTSQVTSLASDCDKGSTPKEGGVWDHLESDIHSSPSLSQGGGRGVVKNKGEATVFSRNPTRLPDGQESNPSAGRAGIRHFVSRTKYLYTFYKLIWQYRNDYDRVFVHMIPMYANIGWPVWRLFKKRIGLWYTHGNVNFSLRLANVLVDFIFTASKDSFRLSSAKVNVLGHGIDVSKFKVDVTSTKESFGLYSVGRISPIKRYEDLIEALKIIKDKKLEQKIYLKIIGGPIDDKDRKYLASLKGLVQDYKLEEMVEFCGSVPYKQIHSYNREADLFLHPSQTGSLDKAILEAMASYKLVLSSNVASQELLGKYKEILTFAKGNTEELANKILYLINLEDRERGEIQKDLRKIVEENHGLKSLIYKIVKILDGKTSR